MSPPSMTEESIRNLIDDKITPIAMDMGRVVDGLDELKKIVLDHVLKEDAREDLRSKNRDFFFKFAAIAIPAVVLLGSAAGYLITHLKP